MVIIQVREDGICIPHYYKKRRGTCQVRNQGTGIPERRNKASPRLFGMSIAQVSSSF